MDELGGLLLLIIFAFLVSATTNPDGVCVSIDRQVHCFKIGR